MQISQILSANVVHHWRQWMEVWNGNISLCPPFIQHQLSSTYSSGSSWQCQSSAWPLLSWKQSWAALALTYLGDRIWTVMSGLLLLYLNIWCCIQTSMQHLARSLHLGTKNPTLSRQQNCLQNTSITLSKTCKLYGFPGWYDNVLIGH